MLAGTRSYYAAKSQASLINSPSVGEYVVEAEAWMVGEEERNKVCFEKDWERVRLFDPLLSTSACQNLRT